MILRGLFTSSKLVVIVGDSKARLHDEGQMSEPLRQPHRCPVSVIYYHAAGPASPRGRGSVAGDLAAASSYLFIFTRWHFYQLFL